MQSLGELARNIAKLSGPDFHAVPHNRFDVQGSGWYVLRTGFRFPAYRYAKLYLDMTDEGLLAAFYVEKGLEYGLVGAPVGRPKLEMNDSWAWRKGASQIASGELDRALLLGATNAGVRPLVLCHCDIPERLSSLSIASDYVRWRMADDGLLEFDGTGSRSLGTGLSEAKRVRDVVRAVETHPERPYMWADLLLGAVVSEDPPMASLIAKLFQPFREFI